MSTLFIFAGLPGTGKTTLSQQLARNLKAVHLRIDAVEQVLRELYDDQLEDKGYRLAYQIAADNLGLGMDVVADSCNPIEFTRRRWEQVATDANAKYVNIEVNCSDPEEHRRRVENRQTDMPDLLLPSWNGVINRVYDDWMKDRIIIDTAGQSETESLEALELEIAEHDFT